MRLESLVVVGTMVIALGLVGCGGGDDGGASSTTSGLAGMYETSAHGENRPCTATPAPLALDPPYLEVVDEDFGGVVVDVYPCTGRDPSTCDENFPLVFIAKEVSSGRFRAEETTKSGTAPSCLVDFIAYGVEKATDGVTVTEERHSGEWMGAICDSHISDEQVAMARSLPCEVQETWSGRKL